MIKHKNRNILFLISVSDDSASGLQEEIGGPGLVSELHSYLPQSFPHP